MNGKTCSICKSFKDFDYFYKSFESKDGYRYTCITCQKENYIKRYSVKKDHILNKNKEWRCNNKNKVKEYWKKDSSKRKEYFKEYRIKNRKKRYEYMLKYMKENINYNISHKLRHRLNMALKSQMVRKTNKALELLGCTIEEFKNHLQSLFIEGMSWKNRKKWHIDHIKACNTFNLSNPEEQKKCFHYSNMQPLWAIDNQRKWIN